MTNNNDLNLNELEILPFTGKRHGSTPIVVLGTVKPEFIEGVWKDSKGKVIQEAFYGDFVSFSIKTNNFPENTDVTLQLFEHDMISDDKITSMSLKSSELNSLEVSFELKNEWVEHENHSDDRTAELYFNAAAKIEENFITKNLPLLKGSYLKVSPRPVKITVIIELPHSKETGWGAKGLAGHTAISIENDFYDYGPDYDYEKMYDEKEYDYDFNDDGDKLDIVNMEDYGRSFKFTPGRPWWGKSAAAFYGHSLGELKLENVFNYIDKHWEQTGIYGEVYKVEFFVDSFNAEKIKAWWDNRYEKLKAYSVNPFVGEQCTTTVITSLQAGGVIVDYFIQTPQGLLAYFHSQGYLQTYNIFDRYKKKSVKIEIIKEESSDWPPARR